ncbi:polyribonucleotide nucleotidyltransferase [Candidatus Curtissbacteria bacterium]|nr:polyribonucleotide nucleotidyltransferase [Candidatus Curtissbacteria bacterium]
MQKTVRKELNLAGKKLILETGELAGQAQGSVLATYGETVVLSTVVSQPAPSDVDFFPLAVDYEERLYAGGKISTSRFIKREGRPSEEAILTARLIDRSIRPLFPKDYQAEVQVIITVLSVDQENDPDIVALIATSAALSISDIPWNGPISGLRIGRQNGSYSLNPIEEEKTFSTLDLILVSTSDEVVMIEATGQEVDEESVLGAVGYGIENGREVIALIEEFTKEAGQAKQDYQNEAVAQNQVKEIKQFIETFLIKDLENPQVAQDENWFEDTLARLEEKFLPEEKGEITAKHLSDLLDEAVADFLRTQVLEKKRRLDGRAPDEMRPITTKVGILPRTHGSGLFQRGETQVLSIVTLGSPALEQLIDGMIREGTKRYMHHYNFPPFSVGEVKRLGAPSRREIGHGSLAEKALAPVLPSQDEFPYTIRVVSEVLSSAGSTSMASASGSTLALMDAGVPIREPVAGISIGLITDKKDKSKFVTIVDIAYQEDAQGDMDFKIAGTKNGVTAIQLDIKLNGIGLDIAKEALRAAKAARLEIIKKILATIPAAREKISKYAPTVILVKIDPAKIGDVIGSGGRVVNRIIAETGVAIDIKDEGNVTISGKDPQACKKAAEWIEGIVKEAKVGEEYEGPVKRVFPFGAMVEILPGKEGLVHASQMPLNRGQRIEDFLKIGERIKVRVVEVDDQGRVNLALASKADSASAGQRTRSDFTKRRFERFETRRGGKSPRRY